MNLSQVGIEEQRNWYALCVRAEVLLKMNLDNRVQALELLEEAADTLQSPWEVHFIGGCILHDAAWPALGDHAALDVARMCIALYDRLERPDRVEARRDDVFEFEVHRKRPR